VYEVIEILAARSYGCSRWRGRTSGNRWAHSDKWYWPSWLSWSTSRDYVWA